jgi:hypothetical protein
VLPNATLACSFSSAALYKSDMETHELFASQVIPRFA